MFNRVLKSTRIILNKAPNGLFANTLKYPSALYVQPKRFYAKEGLILRNEKTGYYQDPQEVARRFIKLLSLHDKVKDPSKITLNSTFYELEIDDLSYVEIMLEAEQEFYLEFPDDDLERFKTVGDVVDYLGRSFYAQ